MAERTGLEPATPGVTGRYSNQLNYRSAKERVVYCIRNKNATDKLANFYCRLMGKCLP